MPSFVRSGSSVVVNSQTASQQSRSSITALADGGFVVTWQTADPAADGSSGAIRSQRYSAQGVAAGPEALVNNVGAGDQTAARTASLAGGGYVVTWQTADISQDGSGSAVKARVFDSSGAAVGGEFRVNSQTFMDQRDPTVTGLADGGFVVAWYTTDTAQDGAGWAVKAQRFDSSGAAVGAEFRVNTTASGSQWQVDIAGLSNGGFVVTWQTGNDTNSQVYGQLYGADGIKVGGQFVANGSIGFDTMGKVAALPGGGFVVTWMTYDAESLGIRAQIFSASGTKIGSDFAVNTTSAGSQIDPDVAVLSDGSFMITWEDQAGGIRGQVYSATGQRVGGETVIANSPDTESGAAVAALAGGNFVVSWTNNSGTASGDDIRLQMLRPNAAPELGAASRAVTVLENQQVVGTMAAADTDGPSPLAYSIVGGADAARFTVYSTTGYLTFVASPNFEAPGDSNGDNVYEVIVRASDGELSDSQTILVTVADRNEAPVIVSSGGGAVASVTVTENGFVVAGVIATDPDGNALVYSISGGADSARFAIDASSGTLSFVAAPDFEAPADSDLDNVYQVVVRVGDGQYADTQTLSVTVAAVDEAPLFLSYGGQSSVARSVQENSLAVATVAVADPDAGSAIVYTLAGADADLFELDPVSGALRFRSAPDFEAPADSDGDNVYEVAAVATSGALAATQAFAVSVEDVDVTIVSNGGGASASVAVHENQLAVTGVAANGPGAITYSIVGGADAARFTIDTATGALAFVDAPNFEWTEDSDHDNVFDVVVRAGNGFSWDDQQLGVVVADVDEDPYFFEYIEGTVALWADENSTDIGVLDAYDVDGGPPLSYAVTGGADGALFVIDPVTGVLAFADPAGRDFEAPGDSDGDNVYLVEVTASAGAWSSARDFSVATVDLNEPLAIISNGGGTSASVSTLEGSRYVTTVIGLDPDGTAPIYSIIGGPDAARFVIDSATGVLSFAAEPDYEAPADSAGANFYTVQVAASDGQHLAWQSVQVLVGNVNEGLMIASASALTSVENGLVVATIAATDIDGDTVSFAIVGGADSALFDIDAGTGALKFLSAPDYEAPADAGGDNVYDIVVAATDGAFTVSKAFTVAVGNANEPVVIHSNGGGAAANITVAENMTTATFVSATDADGGPVTYSIVGGADAARFTINAATGLLAFLAAPNFEAPADSGFNNIYDVVVAASDGVLTDTQALAVTVANVNEPLAIGSNGGGATASISIAENATAVTTVVAADPEGGSVVYSIVGGADAARFTIDAQTGALRFVAAPDWELPADSSFDNVYAVVVRASDGQNSDDQALSVTVGNVRDGNNVTGTASADTISATSTNAALRTSDEEDVVYGRDGHDTILGMAGDDDLYGEGGNDTLTGGTGADRLTGGLGKDQFAYNLVSDSSASACDQILDFSRSQGDKISLSAIDANANAANNQAFAFIGTAAFSGVAGQLRYEIAGGVTTVYGDVNGDGVADLQIQVAGSLTLLASDFVL